MELTEAYNFFVTRNDREPKKKPPESASAGRVETVEEWFARTDVLRGDPLFPEGRKLNPAPVREYARGERPQAEAPTL